jgi:hypothetical protein
MRVRTSLPRSIRPRETRTSTHVCDAKERPCSCRRLGRRGGPAHLAKGRRGAPFRPRSPQSFSEDPASHWVHVQTSTSIDSSVSTLCLRTRVTKRPQSRSAGLALTDTLLPPRTAGVREPLPPRGSRACGYDLPSGGGRVGPRDRRVAAGAAGRADPQFLRVPLPEVMDSRPRLESELASTEAQLRDTETCLNRYP